MKSSKVCSKEDNELYKIKFEVVTYELDKLMTLHEEFMEEHEKLYVMYKDLEKNYEDMRKYFFMNEEKQHDLIIKYKPGWEFLQFEINNLENGKEEENE